MSGTETAARVLVALDLAIHGQATIESGIELASRLGAEVLGLLVEDADLIRSAELPFVRQVNLRTAQDEPFDAASVERELHVLAERAERRLTSLAARSHVRFSFRHVRGRLEEEVETAAEAADVLFLHGRAGLVAPTAAPGAGPLATRTVHVLCEGGEPGTRILEVASRLADGEQVEVLVPAVTPEQHAQLVAAIRRRLDDRPSIRFRPLTPADLGRFDAVVQGLRAELVVLGRESTPVRERGLRGLREALGCAMLVVR